MKITGVYVESNPNSKALATYSVVIENCLKLSNISLYRNEKGYYLTFPSKQDVYNSIKDGNSKTNIAYPTSTQTDKQGNVKKYEEFFYPINCSFYESVLGAIVGKYEAYIGKVICK